MSNETPLGPGEPITPTEWTLRSQSCDECGMPMNQISFTLKPESFGKCFPTFPANRTTIRSWACVECDTK